MKEIPLTQGKVAIVDDDDFERLNQYSWYLNHEGYAVRKQRQDGKSKTVRMHRVVNNTPDNFQTDHINGNRLDNRKENLRSATPTLNQYNRKTTKLNKTGFRGVYKDGYIYFVKIKRKGKVIIIRPFVSAEKAAEAYEKEKQRFISEELRQVSNG